ncbi:imelysin family protein [Bermanella sp. WJH001]|uniref:imelysin family protein n=1 Tax=Bermanella sp. WJH001 TaxID=3048005 RepID=UPI0024BDD515|nr:imelysin family protein [Bermanella sp. WJH001]MDJ1538679.1 imelysin family protein [Bermanella sp. WJH001]
MKSNITLSSLQFTFWLTLVLSLSGCDQFFDKPKHVENTPVIADINSESLLSAANLYVYTQMSDALSKAQELDSIITSLLNQPNPGALEEAQDAWIKAYSAYVKVSFFSNVPRFEKPQFKDQNETYLLIEERIDSWPIEPGYIDYLPLYPLSGIVNDLTLKMNESDISAQHGFSDMRFASLGFHPMEFLLFGVNGKRSAKDFIPQENSIEVVSADTAIKEDDADDLNEANTSEAHEHVHAEINGPQNHNRRRDYLRLLSALVVSNLQKLTDRWEPAHGYYAKQWRQTQSEQQTVNLTLIYQALLDAIQETLLAKHFAVLMNQKQVDDLRSPFSSQDTQNMHDLVFGIESLFNMEGGLLSEIKLQDAETADKSTALFKRLLLDISKLPKNIDTLTLEKRKALLTPIQDKVFQLLEQLYKGAEILRLPVRALPVSTS